ncbi:uncharacterized protein LOC123266017 [Cotesia glomerata]|uniref:uncharacterized protein LOC123266017 n=1 Tax=Cotesia glomerata TaxID=32391 RepID=UPI001D034A04|nr:uncharacterized protein LOC123266017 [Cotesia glomerata]
MSFNDLLYSGGKLQIDLFDVLLLFRLHRYVFSGDIENFYRQIKVHPDDWKFQRILWYSGSQLITYELTTDTYPSRGRYIGDIVSGANTIEEAQAQIKQIIDLCMEGGFPIQKWISNQPDILSHVPPKKHLEALSKSMDENFTVHALGLAWHPRADTFNFTIKLATDLPVTKRKILSAIAQIFDPLGFLTPVVIMTKVFIQELWTVKLGWDDELCQDDSHMWIEYLDQLQELQQLSIPRWIQLTSTSSFEIHGFCDASQKDIAAVAYVRVLINKTPTVTLIYAKTKVAPFKRLIIPRLELAAAVLLSRLLKHVITSMSWDNYSIHCWTDSSITYTWVNNHPSRWKEFVHNRVNFIQETLPSAQCRFVPGRLNPADCATRGLTSSELINHSLWWNGLSWLAQPTDSWPNEGQADFTPENLEEQPDIQILKKEEQLNKNHPLIRLTPWLDPAGIMRVSGRLQNSSLNTDARQPIILPRRHHLSDLVILDVRID